MRTSTVRRFPAPLALVAIVFTAFALMFAWPQSAAAHDTLIDSDPAADATVETLPDELTLTFSAALIAGDGSTAVVVTDAEGNAVSDGEPTVDGAVVTQPLMANGAAGEYSVLWQVVSSDGHPIDGEFSFTVAESAEPTTAPEATTSPEPDASASESPTSTAEPAETAEPEETESDDAFLSALPWIVGAVVVLVAVVVFFVVRNRRHKAGNDGRAPSDAPTER